MNANAPPSNDPEGGVIAAIDIGTNSIRMAVAQVLSDGRVEILEELRRGVRLGQSTFGAGRVEEEAMRAAVAILRDYQRHLELYDVRHLRIVATSSVREAQNADMFLDRVFMSTGFEVDVIDTAEEGRLTVSAVRRQAGTAVKLNRRRTLIGEVGGGSTVLTVLDKGHITNSQSLALGSIRLQEILSTSYESPEHSADLIRQHIAKALASAQSSLALSRVRTFVAVGGDVRFVSHEVGQAVPNSDLYRISREALDSAVEDCVHYSPEALVGRFGLSFADAETLVPALLVYQSLLTATGAEELIVSSVSMRDGLLIDLALRATGQEDDTLVAGVMHSAESIASNYGVDVGHAEMVGELACRLFDELQAEHGLGARQRLLLRVAALLHEVGRFVNSRAHHKHSYYVIANTEIFGLSRDERTIIAHVARYHRRSSPKASHTEYNVLPRRTRMIICKLAALLRVADALDRGHAQQVREFECETREGEIVLLVPAAADLSLERRALETKGDLFADIFGYRIRLDEGPADPSAPRRAEPVQ